MNVQTRAARRLAPFGRAQQSARDRVQVLRASGCRVDAAIDIRDLEKQLRARQEQLNEEWKKAREEKRVTIDEDMMMQVIADWTGIPLSRMEKKESERLLNLEKELQKVVIGQEVAASAIARALRRSAASRRRSEATPAAKAHASQS